jgi:hypothetical protein
LFSLSDDLGTREICWDSDSAFNYSRSLYYFRLTNFSKQKVWNI